MTEDITDEREQEMMGQFHDELEEARVALYDTLQAYKNRDIPRADWESGFDYKLWSVVRRGTVEMIAYAFNTPYRTDVETDMSISRKIMENERMRWGYMNDVALSRRLWKITREDKLEAFLVLARENDAPDWMVGQAIARAEQLDFTSLVEKYKDRAFSTRRPKSQWKKRSNGTKDQEKVHERKIII
jgi:hypothetical protein